MDQKIAEIQKKYNKKAEDDISITPKQFLEHDFLGKTVEDPEKYKKTEEHLDTQFTFID